MSFEMYLRCKLTKHSGQIKTCFKGKRTFVVFLGFCGSEKLITLIRNIGCTECKPTYLLENMLNGIGPVKT